MTLAFDQAMTVLAPFDAPAREATGPRARPLTDAQSADLLARLRHRDRAALAQLVAHFGPQLTRAAYLQTGDAHAAEDLVQETFLAAWDAARRTCDTTRIRPWLLGILLNRCRKYLRSLARRRRREDAAARLRQQYDPPAQTSDARLTALRSALQQLDEPHRAVIVLRHLESLSVAETAQVLRLPPGTVKSRCHHALSRLRQAMENSHA